MAAHSPNGRNSQGVTTVLYPRTDFPEQGWSRTAVYVYSADNFPAISQLAYSFRNVRDRDLGLATVLFRRTDFPEQGWMANVVAETYSTARGVPAVHQLVNSYRNVRDRSLYQEGERKVVQGTNNGESPPPAEFSWFTKETVRTVARRTSFLADQQPQPDSSWMAFAANSFYTPDTMSGWLQPLGNFCSVTSRRYQHDTNRDLSWAINVQQQLVGWAAISQLAESFRNIRNRSLYGDGERKAVQGSSTSNAFIPEYDPQIDPWGISSTRVPGKPYWTSPGPSVDWISNNIQPFDPANGMWAISSVYPRKTIPAQMSWTKSGFFISLFYNPAQAGWTINSQLVPGGPWWTSPDPNTDWIDPLVRTPFNTVQRSDVLESQRVPHDPYWTSQWQGNDWLNPGLLEEIAHDPRQASWAIQTTTYKSRAWWSDSPQEQAWMVPSAKFDPVLWPSTAIPSHRELPKAKGLWQPDLDNAWQEENPPVPNTFNVSFATESNSLNDQGGSPVGSS